MAAKDFDGFSGPGGRPTEAERRLIEACAEGRQADCGGLDEAERQVSADLIVALGTGRFRHRDWPEWELHDRGLSLAGAIITQRLRADERVFPASLTFDGCRFEQAVSFGDSTIDGQLVFEACRFRGLCDFSDAAIAGQFVAVGAVFDNSDGDGGTGRAVWAQGVKAAGWFMDDATVRGEFDIAAAEIGGQCSLAGATFESRNRDGGLGRAVRAMNVSAAHWFMRDATIRGEFDINGATIRGQFYAGKALFDNPQGRALRGDYARFDGGIWLALRDESDGATIRGKLQLDHATIGTRLQLGGVSLDCGTSEGSKAVSAIMARIEGRLVMPNAPVTGIIDLSRAHCDTLEDDHRGWPKPLARGCTTCGRETGKDEEGNDTGLDIQHLVLDGFTYNHLEFPDGGSGRPIGEARIRWLSAQSARALKHQFDPQPWRQCAKTLREMGFDEAAQHVSIERRVRERFADGVGVWSRFVSWFLHAVADYGYSPWKGVAVSLGVVLVCTLAFWGGARLCGPLDGWEAASRVACGGQPAFLQTKFNDFEEITLKDAEGKPKLDPAGEKVRIRPGYPEFRPFAFSADVFLPLLDLGAEGYWRANTRAWWNRHPVIEIGIGRHRLVIGREFPVGWALYVLTVLETIAGSILLAIVITGFTGLLTRDEK